MEALALYVGNYMLEYSIYILATVYPGIFFVATDHAPRGVHLLRKQWPFASFLFGVFFWRE